MPSDSPQWEEPCPVEQSTQGPVNYLYGGQQGKKMSEEKVEDKRRFTDLSMDSVWRGREVAVVGGEGESLVEGGRHPHRLEALGLQPLHVAVRVGALQEPSGVGQLS